MANSNLNKAKVGKNDEFYTQMSDISRELYHYRQHFVGKKIFLNCDDLSSNLSRHHQSPGLVSAAALRAAY